MNGKAFFDTNVLIYAALRNDPRSTRSEELLAVGGVISVQVLNEFVLVARRKFKLPWNDVRVALQWLRILFANPIPMTIDVHEQAVGIAQKYGFGIYDALIVAAAVEAKCSVLYSEDLQNGQIIGGQLAIRNPFL